MLEARDRHQRELFEKFKYYEDRVNEQTIQKYKNEANKIENREKRMQAREQMLRDRVQNKEVQHIVRKVIEDKKSRDKEEDLNYKKAKKYLLIEEKNIHLTSKIKQLEDHHVGLK